MAKARWVPGHYRYGKGSQWGIWEPGHWALPNGRWVNAPKRRPPVGAGVAVDVGADSGWGGLSDAEIEARANALADQQLGVSRDEIMRQQAAAAAMAQRDVSTMRG